MPGTWLRRLALVLLVLLGAVSLVTARAVMRGEAELRESDAAFDEGDLQGAVLHARAAALAYVPGAPHVGSAYARLEAVARGAEGEGKLDIARLAWGATRQAALETRHALSSQSQKIEEAERALARLDAAQSGSAGRAAGPPMSTPQGGGLALGLLALGLGLSVGGVAVVAFRGVDRAGGIQVRGLVTGVIVGLVGVASWVWR